MTLQENLYGISGQRPQETKVFLYFFVDKNKTAARLIPERQLKSVISACSAVKIL